MCADFFFHALYKNSRVHLRWSSFTCLLTSSWTSWIIFFFSFCSQPFQNEKDKKSNEYIIVVCLLLQSLHLLIIIHFPLFTFKCYQLFHLHPFSPHILFTNFPVFSYWFFHSVSTFPGFQLNCINFMVNKVNLNLLHSQRKTILNSKVPP